MLDKFNCTKNVLTKTLLFLFQDPRQEALHKQPNSSYLHPTETNLLNWAIIKLYSWINYNWAIIYLSQLLK